MMKFLKYGLVVLGALSAIAVWCIVAVLMAFDGWWMKPIAPEGDHDSFFDRAVDIVEKSNPGNSAFVLIEDGKVVGEHYAKPDRAVGANTVFPTASFSKWVTALGIMSLVEDNRIGLDDPVSAHLTRWQLPESQYSNNEVTVRRLLSHTAGLTDGLGFGDYSADEVYRHWNSLWQTRELPLAAKLKSP